MYKLLWMLAALFCVLAAPAWAADFKPAPLGTILLDLDTAEQHGSVWELDELGTINAMRATVTIRGLQPDTGRIKPGTMITLSNAGEMVYFMVMCAPATSVCSMVMLHNRGDTDVKEDGGIFLSALGIGVGQPFTIAVDWTAQGEVSVTLSDKETHTAKMSAPPTKLEIDGFASEVEFKPLSIGRTGQ